jgi:serine/threonine-protein kinase RsbW
MGAMLVRHEATSASAVRRELALDLDLHGVDDEIIHDATLVATELIGNAVRHGGVRDDDELGVNWTIGPAALLISVEDPSDELPVLRQVGPEAPSGRGLSIIAALSATWGVERTRRGKRVWAKVELRRSA